MEPTVPLTAQLIVMLLLVAVGTSQPVGTVNASRTRRAETCVEIDRYVGHVPGHLDRVWVLGCD
jgi:hypothetical protein